MLHDPINIKETHLKHLIQCSMWGLVCAV